jgi:DNA topoisomerase I
MQAAQKLYEGVDETGGLITYMRTDGVQTTPEGIAQAREVIGKEYGPAFVRKNRAITRPRPRMLRKRTKRSGRPTSPAIPTACASNPIFSASTS